MFKLSVQKERQIIRFNNRSTQGQHTLGNGVMVQACEDLGGGYFQIVIIFLNCSGHLCTRTGFGGKSGVSLWAKV